MRVLSQKNQTGKILTVKTKRVAMIQSQMSLIERKLFGTWLPGMSLAEKSSGTCLIEMILTGYL